MLAFTKILRANSHVGGQESCLLYLRNYHKKPILIIWRKPRSGWTKLNFDGSCRGREGKSSIGGIFRNHRAEFVLGYAESIGRSTSMLAEMAALRRGLELVLENGWTDIWLEGDAKTLVDMLTRRSKAKCSEANKLLGDMHLIIPELNRCVVTHAFREGNRAADIMAKLGQGLEKPRVWRSYPPEEVLRVVQEDAQEAIVLRRT